MKVRHLQLLGQKLTKCADVRLEVGRLTKALGAPLKRPPSAAAVDSRPIKPLLQPQRPSSNDLSVSSLWQVRPATQVDFH